MQATHVKYPNDRFDVALRRVNASSPPEWRIKCTDCPGKVCSFLSVSIAGFNLDSYINLDQERHFQILKCISKTGNTVNV